MVSVLGTFGLGSHLRRARIVGLGGGGSRFGIRIFLLLRPFPPIIAKEFNGVLRPVGSISTTKIIGWTVLIASPADTFRMLRMDREIRHLSGLKGELCH